MRTWFLACVILMSGCSLIEKGVTRRESFDGERALQLVKTQVDFGPRIPGSGPNLITGNWIIDQLTLMGWETEEQIFRYKEVELRNIIGYRGMNAAGQLVILGTHYDTRPYADKDPSTPTFPVSGANDGASGVAVLLELARVLATDEVKNPIWLVFFDGEDSGRIEGWDWIVGSTYFVENLRIDPKAVIIVDMVGDKQLELFYEKNSNPELADQIWSVADDLGYDAFEPTPKHSLIDDHRPFLERGDPAVILIDFDYPYWHTTQDTIDKVAADSLEQVGRTLQIWITSQQ